MPANSIPRFRFFRNTCDTVAEVRIHVVGESEPTPAPTLSRPDECAEFFNRVVAKAQWFDRDKECAVVLLLDRKNRLRAWNLVSLGSLTGAFMHPREVFRPAVAAAASAVVVLHNHPSGDPAPSAPDLHVTRVLRDAARAIDIEFLDHVIVGRPVDDPTGRGRFSFREAGML